MKNSIVGFLLLLSVSTFAQQQTLTEKFQKIGTVEQAQQFVTANAAIKPSVFTLTAGKDSTLIDKRLLRQKKGDIFSVGYTTYKVLESNESVKYRSNYIFLDGSTLTQSQIDSLRKIIVKRASDGVSFDKLSDEYTMDGNTTHGDTGWFFGEEMMPKEFQDAVAGHNLGDIFFVDVSDKNWHYIVKKTYNDDLKKDMTVIKATGR